VSHRLEVFPADDILFELLRRGAISWRDVLQAGGVDALEVEYRDLLEILCMNGTVVVLSEPL
jgi:hypothetical protein